LLLSCFVFQKKNAVDAYRIIYELYGKTFMVINMCANWFKWFKNCDFDISDKEHSGHSIAVEDHELQKGKSHGKYLN